MEFIFIIVFTKITHSFYFQDIIISSSVNSMWSKFNEESLMVVKLEYQNIHFYAVYQYLPLIFLPHEK